MSSYNQSSYISLVNIFPFLVSFFYPALLLGAFPPLPLGTCVFLLRYTLAWPHSEAGAMSDDVLGFYANAYYAAHTCTYIISCQEE